MALLRGAQKLNQQLLRSAVVGSRSLNGPLSQGPSRTFFNLSLSSSSASSNRVLSDCRSSCGMTIGNFRMFSADIVQYPDIKDPEIKGVIKDFMAADWGELPNAVIYDAKKALSKSTADTEEIEALKNVFRAAEAVEEFIGTLETLKMAIDDYLGLSGENVKPLSEDLSNALNTAYDRYIQYLDSFRPDEFYLKKKVETELGRRMIHLKMRVSGLGSKWGKVSVLGTSGYAGSYIEQRGP